MNAQELTGLTQQLKKGGADKYHEKNRSQGKLFARERIEKLCDKGSFVEDGLFANCSESELPADGVVTGIGKIAGRPIALMANDSTVKAGSWGWRTVEKIVRLQESAAKHGLPLFYLVDSAGARITDQVEMFPGRRGAGRIFFNQANFSGRVPQVCLLFGPSAAGGAYIPAFCDIVILVEGNASMYLGSPRMVESVIGEKVTLEELGGARMHCTVSGCGDFLAKSEDEAIEIAKRYFSYLPGEKGGAAPVVAAAATERPAADLASLVPEAPTRAYDMRDVLKCVVDKGSLFEIKELYAPEVITALARVDGRPVGIVANQTRVKGGVLFVESADKAARFIQLCDAFSLPLLFVSDVPGFMVGSKVEREGIIRAGAKLILAVSRATVPRICVVVRKAYGAGLYAMCGPAFDPDCVIALPTAKIAVMGPEPAVNAVYANKIAEMDEPQRKAFLAEKIAEYEKDVDIARLAGELVVDHLVAFGDLRNELARRLGLYLPHPGRERALGPIFPM